MVVLAAAAMLISCAPKQEAYQGPVKFIIETDMGNDIDDALALAIALRAMDDGKAELLAVGCHKLSTSPAAFCDAVCTYYGHPGIPVAMSLTPVKESSSYVDYTQVEKDFEKSLTEYPEPVALYRKILSEQPDNSVTFVSLGFGTTVAQLLESGPDDISPLTGVELVAKKTKGLSVMCGSYGAQKISEYNVRNDIPAMKTVFEKWPTIIWQNPGEIGDVVHYPADFIEQNLGYEKPNPVAEGYKAYLPMPYNRQCWDLLSVLYPLRPELFTESVPGTVTVDEKGYTWFTPSEDGRHIVLSATLDQPQAMLEALKKMTYYKE